MAMTVSSPSGMGGDCLRHRLWNVLVRADHCLGERLTDSLVSLSLLFRKDNSCCRIMRIWFVHKEVLISVVISRLFCTDNLLQLVVEIDWFYGSIGHVITWLLLLESFTVLRMSLARWSVCVFTVYLPTQLTLICKASVQDVIRRRSLLVIDLPPRVVILSAAIMRMLLVSVILMLIVVMLIGVK